MAGRTVADQLVAQLVDAGVRRIYGIVGDSLNPVVDAVRRTGAAARGGIDWIHVRHEEAEAIRRRLPPGSDPSALVSPAPAACGCAWPARPSTCCRTPCSST